MANVPHDGTLHWEMADDYLGPAAGRFFGSGYRRAEHELRPAGLTATGDLAATASVRYPADWSRKNNTDMRPHLSTVDVLLLGAEVAVTRLRGDGYDPAAARLSAVSIQAGTKAVEDDLTGFAVSAGPVAARGGRAEVPARVANMRLRLTFEPQDPAAGEPWRDFRLHRQELSDVRADLTGPRASAVVNLESERAATMIDGFVIALQLGQIMLYELDGLTRDTSNTLWMRTTTLTSAPATAPVGGPAPTRAALENLSVVRARGGVWRTATVAGEFSGVHTTCAVAHELPTEGNAK